MKLTPEQLNARDTILFDTPYEEKRYAHGGTCYFCVQPHKIWMLIKEGLIDPSERQNDGPSIEEFMEYVMDDDHNGKYLLGGYAVSAKREDERVTIDTIKCIGSKELTKDMVDFIERFHWADELNLRLDWDGVTVRAWWD